jgi:lipopolysaccharide transport protein LptA
MKFFYFALLTLACVWAAPAQTNTATNGVDAILALVTTNQPTPPKATGPGAGFAKPQGPITIKSGEATFDLNQHWENYSDHVQVTNGDMKLTCEWLQSDLPQNGGQPTNIVAETNVLIDFTDKSGQQTHAIGDKAVYFFHIQNGLTNETVTLTRNPPNFPIVQHGLDYIRGSNIVYDLITEVFHVNGLVQAEGWPGTNTPAVLKPTVTKTNQPAQPKPL